MGTARQVVDDLKYIFNAVPLVCLLHLAANKHRLVRGTFVTDDGRGCIMYLLTEILPPEQRITSKKTLTQFFGGDPEAEHYQPARWIVRLWDEAICENVQKRYGSCRHLSVETVMAVIDQVIAERTAAGMQLVAGVSLVMPRCVAPTRESTVPSAAPAA